MNLPHALIVLALAIGVLGACSRTTPSKLDAALEDCRVRAKAGSGEYEAAVQICLTDRAGLSVKLAHTLARAEDWRRRIAFRETPSERWSTFGVYASNLRLASFQGAERDWVERTIRHDSIMWLRVDSVVAR